jgi:hypothetical protein
MNISNCCICYWGPAPKLPWLCEASTNTRPPFLVHSQSSVPDLKKPSPIDGNIVAIIKFYPKLTRRSGPRGAARKKMPVTVVLQSFNEYNVVLKLPIVLPFRTVSHTPDSAKPAQGGWGLAPKKSCTYRSRESIFVLFSIIKFYRPWVRLIVSFRRAVVDFEFLFSRLILTWRWICAT